MKKKTLILITLSVMMFITACGGKKENTEFEKDATQNTESIGTEESTEIVIETESEEVTEIVTQPESEENKTPTNNNQSATNNNQPTTNNNQSTSNNNSTSGYGVETINGFTIDYNKVYDDPAPGYEIYGQNWVEDVKALCRAGYYNPISLKSGGCAVLVKGYWDAEWGWYELSEEEKERGERLLEEYLFDHKLINSGYFIIDFYNTGAYRLYCDNPGEVTCSVVPDWPTSSSTWPEVGEEKTGYSNATICAACETYTVNYYDVGPVKGTSVGIQYNYNYDEIMAILSYLDSIGDTSYKDGI